MDTFFRFGWSINLFLTYIQQIHRFEFQVEDERWTNIKRTLTLTHILHIISDAQTALV